MIFWLDQDKRVGKAKKGKKNKNKKPVFDITGFIQPIDISKCLVLFSVLPHCHYVSKIKPGIFRIK